MSSSSAKSGGLKKVLEKAYTELQATEYVKNIQGTYYKDEYTTQSAFETFSLNLAMGNPNKEKLSKYATYLISKDERKAEIENEEQADDREFALRKTKLETSLKKLVKAASLASNNERKEEIEREIGEVKDKIAKLNSFEEYKVRSASFFYRPFIFIRKLRFLMMGNVLLYKDPSEESLTDGKVECHSTPAEIKTFAKFSSGDKRFFNFKNLARNILVSPLYLIELLALGLAKVGNLIPTPALKVVNFFTNWLVTPIGWIIDKTVTPVVRAVSFLTHFVFGGIVSWLIPKGVSSDIITGRSSDLAAENKNYYVTDYFEQWTKPAAKSAGIGLIKAVVDPIIALGKPPVWIAGAALWILAKPVCLIGKAIGWMKEDFSVVKSFESWTGRIASSVIKTFKDAFSKSARQKSVELDSIKDHSELEPLIEAKDAKAHPADPEPQPVALAKKANPADANHPDETKSLLASSPKNKPAITVNGALHAALVQHVMKPTVIHIANPKQAVVPMSAQRLQPAVASVPSKPIPQPKKPAQVQVVLHEKPSKPVQSVKPKPTPAPVKVLTDAERAAKWAALVKSCDIVIKKHAVLTSKASELMKKDVSHYNLFSPGNRKDKVAISKNTRPLRIR